MEQLMTTAQAAEVLGVSRRFLEISRHRGDGPEYVKVGSAVRYRPSALESWIEQRTVSSTSEQSSD